MKSRGLHVDFSIGQTPALMTCRIHTGCGIDYQIRNYTPLQGESNKSFSFRTFGYFLNGTPRNKFNILRHYYPVPGKTHEIT